MQHRLTALIFYAFLLLNVCADYAEIRGHHISIPTRDIYCSYQSHKPWKTLISEIEYELEKLQKPCKTLVNIDVSSSLLGNDGLDGLSEVLFRNADDVNQEGQEHMNYSSISQRHENQYCKLSLEARMNRLSGQSVAKLLDRIIKWESPLSIPDTEDRGVVEEEKKDIDLNPTLTKQQLKVGLETNPNQNDVQSLDLGYNDLTQFIEEDPALESSLSRFMIHLLSSTYPDSNQRKCIRFDRCNLHPTSCRAIGMGIVKGIQTWNEARNSAQKHRGSEINLALHLSGNEFGCAGTAALAAALKLSQRKKATSCLILDTLDLSFCNVGDAGAEALAFALETNAGCIRNLNLSHNQITQRGVIALARALRHDKGCLETLDLSQNDIGEEGIEALAGALECGSIKSMILRTCSINANGCAVIGTALGKLLSTKNIDNCGRSIDIDLSGNRIGTEKKTKKPKAYSASALTSKASATTMSSLNFIGKKIKSGLRDVGVDMSDPFGVSSLESDDDEEEAMSDVDAEEKSLTSVNDSCGASAFYDCFVKSFSEGTKGESLTKVDGVSCKIGVRMCSFDERGQDALAALFLYAIDHSIKLTLDATMNDGMGNEKANQAMLSGVKHFELDVMAKRHVDLVAAQERARERAFSEAAMVGAFDYDVYDDDENVGLVPSYSDEYDANFF